MTFSNSPKAWNPWKEDCFWAKTHMCCCLLNLHAMHVTYFPLFFFHDILLFTPNVFNKSMSFTNYFKISLVYTPNREVSFIGWEKREDMHWLANKSYGRYEYFFPSSKEMCMSWILRPTEMRSAIDLTIFLSVDDI